jgi:hypothetical protein
VIAVYLHSKSRQHNDNSISVVYVFTVNTGPIAAMELVGEADPTSGQPYPHIDLPSCPPWSVRVEKTTSRIQEGQQTIFLTQPDRSR